MGKGPLTVHTGRGPLLLLLGLTLSACGARTSAAPANASDLRKEDFVRVKRWILERGDRVTFGQMYNQNPHYTFGAVDAFLLPETGQQNINCDPRLSDFDAIVLRVVSVDGQRYATVRLEKDRVILQDPEGAPIVERHWGRVVEVASKR